MKEYGIDKNLEINHSFIGLGSNIKSRKENLTNACSYIKKHVGNIINFSKIYETEPWGEKNQKNFLNQVIKVKTKLTPLKLLKTCKEIEIILRLPDDDVGQKALVICDTQLALISSSPDLFTDRVDPDIAIDPELDILIRAKGLALCRIAGYGPHKKTKTEVNESDCTGYHSVQMASNSILMNILIPTM